MNGTPLPQILQVTLVSQLQLSNTKIFKLHSRTNLCRVKQRVKIKQR